MTEQSQLVQRLAVLRASVRRRLVAYGCCVVLTAVIGGFLLIVALDWLLHLPPPLRAVLAITFVVACITSAAHWILRPLHAQFGVAQVAARLERHFSPLQDRLTSSVDFLEHTDAGSASMMQEVVNRTERIIQTLPLESALTLRPLLRRVLLLVVAVAGLTAAVLLWPNLAHVGTYRYLHPWGRIEWPRRVSILPLTGDQVVAVGDSLTVRMQVQRGLSDALRGLVGIRERDGTLHTLAMQRDADDTFYVNIDAVTEDLTYWYEAGDDSTARSAYDIRVVRRPEVVSALAHVEPPPYALEQSPRLHDLSDGPVRAPIGGQVRVTLRTNKPIAPEGFADRVGLRTETGELILLEPGPTGRQTLVARFPVERDVRFRAELVDEHGFENRGAVTHSIIAVSDTPPTVTVVEPRGATDVTPTGSVPLLIRIEDDFGIQDLELEYQRLGGDVSRIALMDKLEVVAERGMVEATARDSWDLESLSLVPGDVIVFAAVATDNRITEQNAVQVTRSASVQIKIISDAEFDIRLRSDMALLEARIREALLDQEDLHDRTRVLERERSEAEPLTDAERETTAGLAGRQIRLATRVRELAERFGKLVSRIERNRTEHDQASAQMLRLRDLLQQVAGGPMTIASAKLDSLRELFEPGAQQATLTASREQQQAAIDNLRNILGIMAEWGSFHELVTRAQNLLDRQGDLQLRTGEVGKRTLGKPVESLSDSESSALQQAARQQDRLADEVEQLVDKMARLLKSPVDEDPSSADSIDAAIRAGRALGATKHARAAFDAIQENRTAAATIEQRAAAKALQKMIAALRAREDRQLEQLRKRLAEAEQLVASLIEEQQTLRDATHETTFIQPGDAAYASLEQEQRRVRRNAELVGDELAGAKRTREAGRLVREAAAPMETAEIELRERQPAPATVAQDEALAELKEALALLEELARETEQEALRRSLAQIREVLEEILASQTEVNEGIQELIERIAQGGRLGRGEARVATRLARRQADVRAKVDEQLPEFEKVAVYKWALERVAQWMRSSRRALSDRRVDDDLLEVAGRIVRELEKLIRAIEDTEALPLDTEFMEAEGGGGQSGSRQASDKPVPTVAELLVLKAMQTDINDRTDKLHESFDIEEATERQLRDLRIIGEDQSELRRLTIRVVEQAQHP